MPFSHRPPIISSALKTVTAAIASAVLISSAHAAGLGKLTVLSALGQPLRAEIELTAVSSEEAAGLVARLASPDAFRAANIEFNPALLSLRFAIEQRSGRQVIRVSSTQPLNEPFVDLLLELSWNNGRLVREYTFLLDPAELRTTQSAQVAPAAAPQPARANAATPAVAPADAAPAAAPVRQQRPARQAEPPAVADSGARSPAPVAPGAAPTYRVRPGDTLGRIAAQTKPVDISLDMMLVALYRANPDAFIGNNMNRLKSGQILSVPDNETIRGTGEGEARGVVVAHAADFNAYRNKLAGQVATSAPVQAPSASQSAAGKITAKVAERPTAANESQDQLRLSKALPSASGGQGAGTSTEDTIAKEKALAEAQARVKELERNVGELEQLMTVKSKAGTEAVAKATQDPVVAPAPAAVAAPAPAPLVPATPAKPAAARTAAAPEATFADMLMDNVNYLAAGAAVLLLLLLGVAQRRKKKEVKAVVEPSILGLPTDQAHSMFAESGGQSVDTNNSVFNSSFAPSASQLDANEVDPVAEADVYIAYGRDAQAEEILKEALRLHPERLPVRLKLLEIYASRKDQRAFETQAAELYSMTRGQGDEWAMAAALGLSIDALNPLYGSASGAAEGGEQALLAQQLEDAFRRPADAGLDPNLVADAAPTALPDGAAADMGASDTSAERAAASAARTDDEHVLDFDLGGLTYAPALSAGANPVPAPAADDALTGRSVPDLEFDTQAFGTPGADDADATRRASDDLAFDLSFDMNLDSPTASPSPSAPAAEAARANTAPATEQKDPLFDLDAMNFDPPSTAAAPADEATYAPKETAFDFGTVDFDLPSTPAAGAAQEPGFDLDAMDFGQPEAPLAPPEVSFDLPGAALPGVALPEVAASAGAQDPVALPEMHDAQRGDASDTTPQFDMSAIDLDLPGMDDDALSVAGAEAGGAGEMSAAQMEMETKLDLAIAYQEIGDKEGARELLDEVIKGGSSEQVSKANAMLAQLA